MRAAQVGQRAVMFAHVGKKDAGSQWRGEAGEMTNEQ